MASSTDFRLSLWQIVSRHLEIAESIESTANLLAADVPLQSLITWRLDPEQRRVRIVADWPSDARRKARGEVQLESGAWNRLQRWIRQAATLHLADNSEQVNNIAASLGVSNTAGDWLLAPLVGEHGSRGVLAACSSSKKSFTSQDVKHFEAIVEPMAIALDNDARLHELAALREAAEAERQSLLRRLGRTETGEKIVGEDAGLAHVMQRVDLVSRSEVPVLILGETGTGKELVSRAIHNRSERHSGPFMRVNCGAIPRELIDSQLFGHERGAFTGANETRQGWFERADMGTLFLDEIGELPLDAQVRFLRVL